MIDDSITPSAHLLRVEALHVVNFRCFSSCDLTLDPGLTVIVAENGRGKTALLDALALAMKPLVDGLADRTSRGREPAERGNVRLVKEADGRMQRCSESSVRLQYAVNQQRITYTRHLAGGKRSSPADAAEATADALAAMSLQVASNTSPGTLPLIAYYRTSRLHNKKDGRHRASTGSIDRRLAGYSDALSSLSSFTSVMGWFETQWREASDPRFSRELQLNLPILAGVQQAVRTVLAPTGWCDIDWDFSEQSLVVTHPEKGRFPLLALSDGVRSMTALASDIARRCVTLNPHLSSEASLQTPGVLLIDEIDMHLHPRWQQQAVELLRTAFPRLQIVLTTHSPHVLSTVDSGSIRSIREENGLGIVSTPQFQTRGIQSADILARVMDVDPVPNVEEAAWLSEYRALVQTSAHESLEGKKLWNKLAKHFGLEHPVLEEIKMLERLQEFKRQHGVQSE
jgi:predicted ATP-binding protein involved in virulence